MVLTIYDRNGYKRADIAPNGSSTEVTEIQGDHVLSLSFTHYAHIPLDVNDWCDFMGSRYRLTERYTPKEKSTGEWEYNLKLYGIESLIKRFLVLETTDGNAEPVFTLTATPREHVAMVVKCINDGMGHVTDWKVGQVDGTELIVIDYEGKYCDQALKEIAEKAGGGAEWWVEGQTVNVCRCERGEEITLGYGKGVTSLDRDTGNTAKFYTRLFPIGSTRNIDPEKYGSPRLMLPGKRKYVELHTDEYGIYDHYEREAFAHIYPKRTGTVSEVRSEEAKDKEGNPFTIYYFKDDSLNFDPNQYELPGEVKRVSFQSGDLAGLGETDDHYFEVNYDSKTSEFEIVTTWPYDNDTQLPGGHLVPRVGDEYILWNISMPQEYYTLAEMELQTAVDEYNAGHWKDIGIYKAPTDHVWVEENEASLYIGRRVRLESEQYFPDKGYRNSRITKITRKVNLPSQMDLEISDALWEGARQQMNDSIGELKSYVKSKSEGGGLPDIIRSWDNTLPTDTNLFSAKRSKKEFLSKIHPDRAKKKITFEEGIGIGQEENGGIDGQGNADLLSLVVRELLRSPQFVDGFNGEGWKVWMEGALSHLTIDKLTVRRLMVVFELLIEKIRSVGGQLCVSAANGKIKDVETEGDYYLITFEQENTFAAHDLMRCQTFTGGALKSYWVEVAASTASGIVVAQSEFGEAIPDKGDECVLMGNTANKNRQNLILLSATEDGQPRMDVMDGVSGKHFKGCLRARLGNLDGINDDLFPADNQPRGNGLYSDNAYLRGTFLLVTGEDIRTKFEIVEGKITSSVTALRNDLISDKSCLNNPAFNDGLAKWQTENETVFFLLGNRWIWANKHMLSRKGNGASVVQDDGRTVVRIKNGYILQTHGNLRSIPKMPENGTGEKEAQPMYLTFFYRCTETGTLNVKFENVDKTGFANFNSMDVTEELAATEGYVQYSCDGLWNGTGDFRLSFTGDVRLYMLVLSTDKVEALAYRYKTLFEQSERLVKISAAVFDKDENCLQETGLMVKPEGSGIYMQGADGKLALIGVGMEETGADGEKRTVIKLSGDHIRLEGDITANGSFHIDEDGDVHTDGGTVGGFTIDGYSLKNKKGQDARISILSYAPKRDANGSPVYDTEGNPVYEVVREATLGNNIPPSAGIDTNAVFVSREKRNSINAAVLLEAAGSTQKYNVFGGNANFAAYAVGGCQWHMNEGDHWCMPGFLCLVHIDVSMDFKLSSWTFGNGVGLDGVNIVVNEGNQGGQNFVYLNFTSMHDRVRIMAQADGQDYEEKGRWGLVPCCEGIHANGVKKKAQFSFWKGSDKYIPRSATFFFFGEPSDGIRY